MEKKRKIQPVVQKFSSFQEAENADDEYWTNTTAEERLNALIDLRKAFLDDSNEIRIQKVVIKRSIYEEEAD